MGYGDRAPFMYRGYVRLYRPEHPLANRWGHVMEHRMVAWDHGIITDPRQVVHHINHDRSDNRPENLRGMTHSDHAAHHASEHKRTPEQTRARDRARYLRRFETKTCQVCGRDFQWRNGDADPRGCGNACRAILKRREGWRPAYRHLCEVCGREFRSRAGDGRVCSPTCRSTLRKMEKNAVSYGNDPCTVGLP